MKDAHLLRINGHKIYASWTLSGWRKLGQIADIATSGTHTDSNGNKLIIETVKVGNATKFIDAFKEVN